MNQAKIRTRILVPLSLTFLVLLGSFLYSAYAIRGAEVSSRLDREYGTTLSIFKKMLSSKNHLMALIAHTIIDDPHLQHAMRHRNRAVLNSGAQLYTKLLATNGVTHFYFHDIHGTNFLRVHQPDYFGDSITRNSLQRAMQTGLPAHGLELGPFGTLTLRLVIPWSDRAGLLGYLELGTEINDILDDISILNNIDFLITVNKEFLNKETYAAGYQWVGKQVDWDQFPDKIIAAQSIDKVPPDLSRLIANSKSSSLSIRSWKTAILGDKQYALKSFPFKETSGQAIGEFILLYDTTQQNKKFNQFITITLFSSIMVCLILFTFAWRILGQIEITITQTQHELAAEVSKVTEANRLFQLEIAEREKAESALSHLNTHLEKRIADRTRHLEATTRELEQGRSDLEKAFSELRARQAMILHQDKMASIGLLAAGVAHDINNPIGFVSNNLEELRIYLTRLHDYIRNQDTIVQTCAPPDELEKLREDWNQLGIEYILDDFEALIAESLEGASRVSDIVKNLRSFSRVDDFSFKLADINECLESSIKITQHELRHKAQIHRQYGEIPAVFCCPQQLNQAFMNLLVNAAHAIDKRGDVTLRSWADTEYVYIAISDSGCGIPEHQLSKIFEPFYTTKEAGKGTGLGLSIVNDIISLHHGEISVQSRLNQGTTFTIKLPLRPEVNDA